MTDHSAIVTGYLAAWNETDPAVRAKLVSEVFAVDATYTDPMAEVSGHDGIGALIGAAQQRFAGLVFTPGGPADGHHDLLRFQWHLAPAGATEPVAIGFDAVRLDADGRITTVFGFLDKVPG